MGDKGLKYLNIALILAIVAGMTLLIKTTSRFFVPMPQAKAVSQVPAGQAVAPVVVKTTDAAEAVIPPENIRDLKDVYANYPKEDAGSNMIEAWARVKPEDKAKYIEGVDKQIEEAKGMLAADPSNKKAKHMLFIAETMRKLTENNFNYSAPQEPKIDEERSKTQKDTHL